MNPEPDLRAPTSASIQLYTLQHILHSSKLIVNTVSMQGCQPLGTLSAMTAAPRPIWTSPLLSSSGGGLSTTSST